MYQYPSHHFFSHWIPFPDTALYLDTNLFFFSWAYFNVYFIVFSPNDSLCVKTQPAQTCFSSHSRIHLISIISIHTRSSSKKRSQYQLAQASKWRGPGWAPSCDFCPGIPFHITVSRQQTQDTNVYQAHQEVSYMTNNVINAPVASHGYFYHFAHSYETPNQVLWTTHDAVESPFPPTPLSTRTHIYPTLLCPPSTSLSNIDLM